MDLDAPLGFRKLLRDGKVLNLKIHLIVSCTSDKTPGAYMEIHLKRFMPVPGSSKPFSNTSSASLCLPSSYSPSPIDIAPLASSGPLTELSVSVLLEAALTGLCNFCCLTIVACRKVNGCKIRWERQLEVCV